MKMDESHRHANDYFGVDASMRSPSWRVWCALANRWNLSERTRNELSDSALEILLT